MNHYEINLLGDKYSLISPMGNETPCECDICVLPSLVADFAINTRRKPHDYYAAALCVAAFFSDIRGLPLSDISLETPKGIIEVFNTGHGRHTVLLEKCKQLLTYTDFVLGCDVEYSDVYLAGAVVRVLLTEDISLVSENALRELAMRSQKIPDAVVAYSNGTCGITLSSASTPSDTPPSMALICAAAAYREYIRSNIPKITLCGLDAELCIREYGVELSVGCSARSV